jgi:hypothetical protein
MGPPVLQKKVFFTERQLRLITALQRTGHAGTDRSDIVRRAVDAKIDAAIAAGIISESDGGALESVADED